MNNTPISYGFTYTSATSSSVDPTFGPTAWAAINWPVNAAGEVQTLNGVNPSTQVGGGLFIGPNKWEPKLYVNHNNTTYLYSFNTQDYYNFGPFIFFSFKDAVCSAISQFNNAHEIMIRGITPALGAGKLYTIGGTCIWANGDSWGSQLSTRVHSVTTNNGSEYVIQLYNYSDPNNPVLFEAQQSKYQISGGILVYFY